MRVSEGAPKINSHGGAIHIHDDKTAVFLKMTSPSFRLLDAPQSPLASIEVRDFVYNGLIGASHATCYDSALITGDKGLLERGLNRDQFSGYGGLSAGSRERERLCLQLLQKTDDQFHITNSLRGVPGFWEDACGFYLWKEADHRLPRLLIPVRDGRGRIQACQMRLPSLTKKSLRYCWLSSSGLPYGASPGIPLHFTFTPSTLPDDATIVIFEGALKADVLYALRPELYFVATAGVSANHAALIDVTRGRRALIAFGQDHHYNEALCLRLAALIARRMASERTLTTTYVAVWDRGVKGIDDAALHNLPITSINVQRWFNQLSPDFQRKVAVVLNREQK